MTLGPVCAQDDRKHRAAWRELYTDSECVQLAQLVTACAERGIGFVYGMAPGLDIVHSSIAEQSMLKEKLKQVLSLGVTRIAMLFDDISDALHPQDEIAFGSLVRTVFRPCVHFLTEYSDLVAGMRVLCGLARNVDGLHRSNQSIPDTGLLLFQ